MSEPESFGELPDGRPVRRHRLRAGAIEADVIEYGAILQALRVPDRDGRMGDVVLGFAALADYVERNPYFGATIGRVANRIARGRFELDGVEHRVTVNEPPSSVHGGACGFDARLWSTRAAADDRVELGYRSADGEEGYPGELAVDVLYRLVAPATLRIEYTAQTTASTLVNLTNHSFFHLEGEGAGDVLGQLLTIDAARYLPVDADLIPTGGPGPVDGTPFDFRVPRRIGARIADIDEQLVRAGGYDHNYLLDRTRAEGELAFAARVEDPVSGRHLELWTTEPAIDVYAGNLLDGSLTGKSGRPYGPRAGLAIEPEKPSDAIHRAGDTSTILRPGERYRQVSEYRFGVAP